MACPSSSMIHHQLHYRHTGRWRVHSTSGNNNNSDRPSSSSSFLQIFASADESNKVNGSSYLSFPYSISFSLSKKAAAVLETSYALSGAVLSALAGVTQQLPQHIIALPPAEVHVDTLKQGRLVEKVVYRQTFVVRSYEVGADRTATLDTFLNLFQETALNHVLISGLAGNGFGTTHEMIRNNLIWVVTRMQVQVDSYPAWGNALEIDTWVGASGKNGMRRDWLVRDYKTGSILARATSTWVMMNKSTRRLSKMPNGVRAEISPWFLERTAFIQDSSPSKIVFEKADDTAQYICKGLTPRHSDLDMNQHVNNVKYLAWMMESLPRHILESHQVVGVTLEYRKECGKRDVVESFTKIENGELVNGSGVSSQLGLNGEGEKMWVNGSGVSSQLALNGEGEKMSVNGSGVSSQLDFIHLLRMQTDGSEIVRARTTWKSRL